MKARDPELSYFIAAVLSPVIWGFFAVPLRNLSSYSSEVILYYRLFVSLAISLAVILLFRKKALLTDARELAALPRSLRRKLLLLVLISVLLLTANWLSFIYVVNRVSLQAAAFAYMVCPIITAFLSYLLLKENIARRKWIAIGVSMLSVLILASGFLLEVSWSIGVALFFALYLVVQRRIHGVDRFNLLAVQLLLASLLVLPFFLWQYQGVPVEPGFWINIVVISLVFTVIPLFLNLYALVQIPSSTVGILIYINPIVAFAVAFLYFGDKTSLLQVTSYTVLLCAVVIFNWGYLSKRIKRKPN